MTKSVLKTLRYKVQGQLTDSRGIDVFKDVSSRETTFMPGMSFKSTKSANLLPVHLSLAQKNGASVGKI